MVATPLFGRERPDPEMSHLALLDGVRASFLLSTEDDALAPADWAWSANVRHHVLLKQTQIVLSRNSGSAETFERRSVESKLGEFLRYLEIDPGAQKTAGAIDHLIRLFRKHRATLREKRLDAPHLDSFLYLLAISETEKDFIDTHRRGQLITKKYALTGFDHTILSEDYVSRFVEELRLSSVSQRRLLTPLTVRHAGGALFQEAHAEVLSEPTQMTLFGLAEAGQQRFELKSLGVYYTPPGLARTLTEIAIAPHLGKDQITINDPACGSGIFLCEAIRALQRQRYTGKIVLSGCDISEPAIQMARFSIASALLDWPQNKIEWKVETKSFFDSITADSKFTVVLMNPPFQSWEALSDPDRDLVRQTLGDTFAGKPDFSTAFVQGSLDHLDEGGTLATLLPRGVLDSQRGRAWRESTLTQADLRFVGTFGDHGLFRHAMVSIGAAVFERRRTNAPTVMIWADERSNSADSALRALRYRLSTSSAIEERSENWSIYTVKNTDLGARKSWLPTPNALGRLLDVIRQSNFPRVGELFTVRQGIKTGFNEAFVLSDDELAKLPAREHKHFRKVANGEDIHAGRITAR
jgi:predicted RNA methylase